MTIDDHGSDSQPDRTSTRVTGSTHVDAPTPPEGPGDRGTRPSDDGPEENAPAGGRSARWAAGHVIIAVIVALVLGGLFNAEGLLATAERQEFGATRDLSVAAAERLVTVSRMLGLVQPRRAIDQALGRTDEAGEIDDPSGDGGDPDGTPTAGDLAADDPTEPDGPDTDAPDDGQPTGIGESGPDDAAGTDDGSAADASGPGSDRGPITEDDPLTMYIGGDSMVGQFGTALEDLVDDTGKVETTEILYEFGSGLTRPDFIDWNVIMAEVSREQDPDVIVLYFGGNDAQPLKLDGVVYEPEDEPWQQEYRSRVNALMSQLQQAEHTVYWMGMPIPRSATLQQRYIMLNDIYESEADAHPAVTFIPAWDHFTGPNGEFSEYLPNASGDVVDMRLDDGIHYTTAGAYRIARVAADRIITDHGITPVS